MAEGTNTMTQVIADETLRAKLNGCRQEIEVLDEAGKPLGHFVPEAEYKKLLYAWVMSQCPYTPEDFERFRKERGGRPLAEIWKSLGAK
jgi:hypothetical protein